MWSRRQILTSWRWRVHRFISARIESMDQHMSQPNILHSQVCECNLILNSRSIHSSICLSMYPSIHPSICLRRQSRVVVVVVMPQFPSFFLSCCRRWRVYGFCLGAIHDDNYLFFSFSWSLIAILPCLVCLCHRVTRLVENSPGAARHMS